MCKHIKFYASLRAESKLITLQSEFVIFSFLQPEKNVRMMLKWHRLVIDSWSLTAQIRNSVCGQREFCKITMTSSRHNFHFSTSTPLLVFDWQPPPWYKFLSHLSLLLPLKSKMVAIIFVTKILSSRLPKLHLLCRLVNHTTCLQNSQVSRIECKTPQKNSI